MKNRLVIFLLLMGVIMRGWYFFYPLGRSAEITVDEAVYGVQALRILEGERPVFYPAQDYTGSFSAYLAAVLFKFFGPSSFSLKIVPFVFSLGTLFLIYLLAVRVFKQTTSVIFSLAVASLGTPFWNNWASRAGSGYVEATFFGLLLLILASDIVGRHRQGLKVGQMSFFILGFLSGFGFWLQPTIVYFVLPVLLYLFLNLGARLFLVRLPAFVLGLALGVAPVIFYNFYVKTAATTVALWRRPWGVRGALIKLIIFGFPVLLGGRAPGSTVDFSVVTSAGVYFFFAVSFCLLLRNLFLNFKLSRPILLLILNFFATVVVFSLSTPFNQQSLEPRYVFALYASLPLILGFSLGHFWQSQKVMFFSFAVVIFLNSLLGLIKAGPLTFLDGYSLKPLVSFLKEEKIGYVMATPALGHRIMFFTRNSVKAAVRGGGISEARFESLNQEITKIRDSDPRLVAYVSLRSEKEVEGLRQEARSQLADKYGEALVGGEFLVFYSR